MPSLSDSGAKASPSLSSDSPPGPADARALRALVTPYAKADTRRGAIQLSVTALPYLTMMAAMLVGLYYQVWLALLMALPAALFLVRLFMIQHDCGHGSFFKSRWANNLLGSFLSVLTMTPYQDWRRCHATHHADTGNLDRRGVGDITTMTVREYLRGPWLTRFGYRLYRHPLILFGVGPGYQFLVRFRIPSTRRLNDLPSWFAVMGTNAAIAAIMATLALTVGARPFLLAFLPVILLASTIGVWMFYVQHQFEETYWEPDGRWNFDAAALAGSSYYDLPRVLHWLTAYIGFHHIHHLSSRIPNYRLSECFRDNPPLWNAKRLTLMQSFRCLRLALWDEDARRLVPFRALRKYRGERAGN